MSRDRSKVNAYQAEWDKLHTTTLRLKLNNNTDAEIIAHLKRQPSMQGYIKTLIRADLEARRERDN